MRFRKLKLVTQLKKFQYNKFSLIPDSGSCQSSPSSIHIQLSKILEEAQRDINMSPPIKVYKDKNKFGLFSFCSLSPILETWWVMLKEHMKMFWQLLVLIRKFYKRNQGNTSTDSFRWCWIRIQDIERNLQKSLTCLKIPQEGWRRRLTFQEQNLKETSLPRIMSLLHMGYHLFLEEDVLLNPQWFKMWHLLHIILHQWVKILVRMTFHAHLHCQGNNV